MMTSSKESCDEDEENIKNGDMMSHDAKPGNRLVYQITETPPVHVMIIYALQVSW